MLKTDILVLTLRLRKISRIELKSCGHTHYFLNIYFFKLKKQGNILLLILLGFKNRKKLSPLRSRPPTTTNLLNNRVFLLRNYRLIVAPRRFDVLKTNVCPRSEALRENMLVLRTSNFQGAIIRPIVPRHKHSIVFIVHH